MLSKVSQVTEFVFVDFELICDDLQLIKARVYLL